MSNAVELKRIFKMGSVSLPNPDAKMTPEEVLKAYAVNYSYLENATVEGPEIEGEELVYEFIPMPAKSKG